MIHQEQRAREYLSPDLQLDMLILFFFFACDRTQVWLVWATLCSAAAILYTDYYTNTDQLWIDLPDLAIRIVLYALIPSIVLPTISYLASLVTLAAFLYFNVPYFTFVPVGVLLAHAGITPPLAVALAVGAMLLASPLVYAGLGLLAVLTYYGVFLKIKFSQGEVQAFTLWYREHVGPYKNVGAVFGSIISDLKQAKLEKAVETMAGKGIHDCRLCLAL